MRMRSTTLLLLVVLLSPFCLLRAEKEEALTCSVVNENERDPALKEMTYDVGDGPQSFWAYVMPDVTEFYRDDPPASTKVIPKFNGLAGKFINMSNKRLALYWESRIGGPVSAMKRFRPFDCSGTGTFPGHRFFFTPEGGDAKRDRLIEFVIKEYPENLYVYDPCLVEGDEAATEANLQASLTPAERELYDLWKKTLLFSEQYRNFTGRTYLSAYLRDPPKHFMWRADYFGQEHWVTTRETHFEKLPPLDEMDPIMMRGEDRVLAEHQPRNMQQFRVQDTKIMNMTLKVLSCAPRVFEIPNFLSPSEVQHILELAGGIELSVSTTGDATDGTASLKDETSIRKTRTSYNSWVPRERTEVIDAIYRRSADLLRIDEALLRSRGKHEYPDLPTRKTVAESLQLVHYGVGQEYTAHHDFGYSYINEPFQEARFATLLLYLNDGMRGGETSFPRWINAETFRSLSVKPEVGKAVLFYSQLPDGNMDDFSQHAAEPVTDGEKWLINLWVHDPVYEL